MQDCLHQQLDIYNRKQQNVYKASWGTAMQFMDGATEIMGKQYDETYFARVFEEKERCRSEKK